MIKLIVKYKTQIWEGTKYIYPELSKILRFKTIEDVTDENIKNSFNGWVEILDIKQVVV